MVASRPGSEIGMTGPKVLPRSVRVVRIDAPALLAFHRATEAPSGATATIGVVTVPPPCTTVRTDHAGAPERIRVVAIRMIVLLALLSVQTTAALPDRPTVPTAR